MLCFPRDGGRARPAPCFFSTVLATVLVQYYYSWRTTIPAGYSTCNTVLYRQCSQYARSGVQPAGREHFVAPGLEGHERRLLDGQRGRGNGGGGQDGRRGAVAKKNAQIRTL